VSSPFFLSPFPLANSHNLPFVVVERISEWLGFPRLNLLFPEGHVFFFFPLLATPFLPAQNAPFFRPSCGDILSSMSGALFFPFIFCRGNKRCLSRPRAETLRNPISPHDLKILPFFFSLPEELLPSPKPGAFSPPGLLCEEVLLGSKIESFPPQRDTSAP